MPHDPPLPRFDPDALRTHLAALAPPHIPAREFPVAAPAGGKDALPAVRAALAACAAAGGGRVIVPPGEHDLRGPIVLSSHTELHLPAGCTLRFSPDANDYLPAVRTRWEGTELWNYSPLITARHATDIALTGAGTLDGRARDAFAGWRERQKPAQDRLRDQGRDGVPVDQRRFGAGDWLRPSFFQPLECTRVLVEGVTFCDAPFWVVHPTLCHHVIVRGVTVESLNPNNDGCDPDSCTDVLIERCRFHTGDDAIALKSGRDQDGWRVGRAAERVLVRHCTLSSLINGLCIGSEMSGGVRDVLIEHCHLGDVASAIYLKANPDRGGTVERLHVREITVQRCRAAVVRCETAYHSHRGGRHWPVFRDLVIERLRCDRADTYGLCLEGTAESPVREVTLREVNLGQVNEPYWLRHVEDLRCERVFANGRPLPVCPAPTPSGQRRRPLPM
jgi:polygalacturonase